MNNSTFNLTGTARRRELWLALAIVLLMLGLGLGLQASETHWRYARFAEAAMALSLAWALTVALRRLHALGRHGAWALALLVPIFGAFVALILLVKRGKLRLRSQTGITSVVLVSGLFVLIGLLRFVYLPAVVPAENMKPSLLAGDYLLSRYISGDDVSRGDVVLIRRPQGEGLLTARVIALGGDQVQMKEGRVWLNGVALPQVAAGVFSEIMGPQGPRRSRPRCEGGPIGDGGLCHKSIWTETLPQGPSYDVLNIQEGAFGDDTAQYTIPQGQMFLLGDNRDNSLDSRYATSVGGLGLVSVDQVVARAWRVLFSSQGARMWYIWAWRYDRFFEAVK